MKTQKQIKYSFDYTIKFRYRMCFAVLFDSKKIENYRCMTATACNDGLFDDFAEYINDEQIKWGTPATIIVDFPNKRISVLKKEFIIEFSKKIFKFYGLSRNVKINLTKDGKYSFKSKKILYPYLIYFILKTVRQGATVACQCKPGISDGKLLKMFNKQDFYKTFIEPSRAVFNGKLLVNHYYISATIKRTHIIAFKKYFNKLTDKQRTTFCNKSGGIFDDLNRAKILDYG